MRPGREHDTTAARADPDLLAQIAAWVDDGQLVGPPGRVPRRSNRSGPGARPAGQIITEAGDAVDAYPQSGLRHILHRLRLDSARLIRLNLGDGGTRRRRRQWPRPRLWTTPVDNGTGCPHLQSTPGAAFGLIAQYARRSRVAVTWCSSAVNRASLSRRATSRTRPSALNAWVSALGPGCVLPSVFPLARSLLWRGGAPLSSTRVSLPHLRGRGLVRRVRRYYEAISTATGTTPCTPPPTHPNRPDLIQRKP